MHLKKLKNPLKFLNYEVECIRLIEYKVFSDVLLSILSEQDITLLMWSYISDILNQRD